MRHLRIRREGACGQGGPSPPTRGNGTGGPGRLHPGPGANPQVSRPMGRSPHAVSQTDLNSYPMQFASLVVSSTKTTLVPGVLGRSPSAVSASRARLRSAPSGMSSRAASSARRAPSSTSSAARAASATGPPSPADVDGSGTSPSPRRADGTTLVAVASAGRTRRRIRQWSDPPASERWRPAARRQPPTRAAESARAAHSATERNRTTGLADNVGSSRVFQGMGKRPLRVFAAPVVTSPGGLQRPRSTEGQK
jgi:hypothetical protein